MEQFYWAALGVAKGIETAQLVGLVDFFGSARAVWEATKEELMTTGLLSQDQSRKFWESCRQNIALPERLAECCYKQDIQVYPIRKKEYPERLRQILHPPAVLYVRGQMPDCQYSVAVVGSRQPEAYGRKAACWFAEELARAGVVIVSGGARGIDTAAHEGALHGGGKTVAVLGCGVDIAYPQENRTLFAKIAETGAVISEYMPGTPPCKFRFPQRNRIISGISQGVILAQAAARSGALITAEFALDEGREVFCIPGPIFSSHNAGSHKLIKTGARLVDAPQDVLAELFPELEGTAHSNLFPLTSGAPAAACSAVQKKLLDLLTQGPQTLEELTEGAQLDVGTASLELLSLQLKGFVDTDAARRYIRT